MPGHFAYHFHVWDRRESVLPSVVHVTRSGWKGLAYRVSQDVMSLPLGDFHIDPGTPLDQAIACAEALLAALILEREQSTPEAYDHP